jgi:hypothetical protein
MYHVVFLDSADDTYSASEVEAIAWIRSRLPQAAFTPWRGTIKYAYADERTRDLAETQAAKLVRCSAFIVDTSKPNAPLAES